MKVETEHSTSASKSQIVNVEHNFTYKIFGTAADPPLKGGDGGAGGIGGLSGDIRIVNLSQQHQIKFEQRDGNF